MTLLFPLVIVTVLSQASPVLPVGVKTPSPRDPADCGRAGFHT